MSLHERAATFRSPGHHRQLSGDRNDEMSRPSLARSSSGAIGGGSEGRELHERFPTAWRLRSGESLQAKGRSGTFLPRAASTAVLLQVPQR